MYFNFMCAYGMIFYMELEFGCYQRIRRNLGIDQESENNRIWKENRL